MKASKTTSRQARRIHRWLVPIAAAPLLITAGTGFLYSLLLEQNIDAFWLLSCTQDNSAGSISSPCTQSCWEVSPLL